MDIKVAMYLTVFTL